MAKFGLIGRSLSHSFSCDYFTKKFRAGGLPHNYENFELETIEGLAGLLKEHPLQGFNVTIPYKEAIRPFLDQLDQEAKAIGAVNTVKINKSGRLVGYNTDHWGFARALEKCGPLKHKTALILGTGGASKAIRYALAHQGFKILQVSRNPVDKSILSYDRLNEAILQRYLLIVNCTPLGTWPDTGSYPSLPYQNLTPDHLLFDLVYNPYKTRFMELGEQQGARICNGLDMLQYQAEKSWTIWND